jgi:hypothetical protein
MRGTQVLRLATVALAAGIVSAMAAAPSGPTEFDGKWFVQAASEIAACTTAIPPIPLPIAVENGEVRDYGIFGASATGSVDAGGKLTVSFSYDKDVFEVRGALKGDRGNGKWTSVTLSCSGLWVAEKL